MEDRLEFSLYPDAPMVWSAYLNWLDHDDVTELDDVRDVLPADLEG